MFEFSPLIFIFIILAVYFLAKIKVLTDQERFAQIILGQFHKFKGSGLLVKWAGSEVKWIKLSIGDRGEVLTPGRVRIQNRDLPFKSDNSIQIGNFVRTIGFTEDKLIVTYDNNQERSMICEKCGHENVLA